ncbi:hypothetical protein MC7420_4741 [Coleofasciculus chthonoplastes PCC 7420]|uniref:Uncharacterized protein n=1 Tax=Coleofasciculus chthonoplastes PCC 7420 TaxID=118168 RepID=B4VNJ8_9CYAN|nr:hypothetical protein [Coleofasciculus chthonoplastes]EDX76485.1 hypothetical protein MC7420_4741 [Coleofasciculus chthonoplastes PCC 7420]
MSSGMAQPEKMGSSRNETALDSSDSITRVIEDLKKRHTEIIENVQNLNSEQRRALEEQLHVFQDLQKQLVNTLGSNLGISSQDNNPVTVQNSGTQGAAERAMNVASRVKDIGFVEFTTGLINGTFDALVSSTIKQIEQYSQLVKELAKTFEQFKAENVAEADIDTHLAKRYPDGTGGTVVRDDYEFKDDEDNNGKKAKDKLEEVVNALKAETKLDLQVGTGNKIPEDDIQKIREKLRRSLAKDRYMVLYEMVKMGLSRIVVTDGEINTKLTFNVTSYDSQIKQRSNYNQNLNRVHVKGNAGGLWWKVEGGLENTNLNVNTVNESSSEIITTNTQMIGEVKLRFKSDYFPLAKEINLPPDLKED